MLRPPVCSSFTVYPSSVICCLTFVTISYKYIIYIMIWAVLASVVQGRWKQKLMRKWFNYDSVAHLWCKQDRLMAKETFIYWFMPVWKSEWEWSGKIEKENKLNRKKWHKQTETEWKRRKSETGRYKRKERQLYSYFWSKRWYKNYENVLNFEFQPFHFVAFETISVLDLNLISKWNLSFECQYRIKWLN